jgi:hypothetical protein
MARMAARGLTGPPAPAGGERMSPEQVRAQRVMTYQIAEAVVA